MQAREYFLLVVCILMWFCVYGRSLSVFSKRLGAEMCLRGRDDYLTTRQPFNLAINTVNPLTGTTAFDVLFVILQIMRIQNNIVKIITP